MVALPAELREACENRRTAAVFAAVVAVGGENSRAIGLPAAGKGPSGIVSGGATPATATDFDLGLVEAYRRGDDAAFAALLARYERRIRGMCSRYLHDSSLVEDVVQETFCRVLETIDRVEPGYNLSAWIHRIAANLCLDELRRRSRRQGVEPTAGNGAAAVPPQIVDTERRHRPDEALEQAQTNAQVWEAIRRVPQRQRRVLILRDVHGLSHTAIRSLLRMPAGAVQGTLHRARERFKHEYLALDGCAAEREECAKVEFIVDTLRPERLRKDTLRSVERHVQRCGPCARRYHWLLSTEKVAAGVAKRWRPRLVGTAPVVATVGA
jgi:RNA polymerase sigma-70 factor (ECF subfamily)